VHAYPNPFSTRTTIEFELPLADSYQKTTIRIFNILGQQVRLLLAEPKSANKHRMFWDGRDDLGFLLTSGVYFIELESGTFHQVQKIVLVGPRG
jgi:flagellar hook assembly protein FlgD